MPRIARKYLENGFFHVMIQGIKKEEIFYKKEYKEKYIELMKIFLQKQDVKIIAYCIMNNHAHLILYAEEMQELTKFMERLNTTYAMHYNKHENRVGYVYRDRFKSKELYNQDYLTKCIKYVHMNPVKAGIVSKEEHYPYSSYNDYIHKTGFITEELIKEIFNSKYHYLKEFLQIEYNEDLFQDLEEEKIDKEQLEQQILFFIEKEEIAKEELQEDKRLIRKLYHSLKIKPTKAELARQIGISRSKITKILSEEK